MTSPIIVSFYPLISSYRGTLSIVHPHLSCIGFLRSTCSELRRFAARTPPFQRVCGLSCGSRSFLCQHKTCQISPPSISDLLSWLVLSSAEAGIAINSIPIARSREFEFEKHIVRPWGKAIDSSSFSPFASSPFQTCRYPQEPQISLAPSPFFRWPKLHDWIHDSFHHHTHISDHRRWCHKKLGPVSPFFFPSSSWPRCPLNAVPPWWWGEPRGFWNGWEDNTLWFWSLTRHSACEAMWATCSRAVVRQMFRHFLAFSSSCFEQRHNHRPYRTVRPSLPLSFCHRTSQVKTINNNKFVRATQQHSERSAQDPKTSWCWDFRRTEH